MNYVKLAIIGAVLLAAFSLGFRVGTWRQGSVDASAITGMEASIANFNAAQAAAEKRAREEQAAADAQLINGMKSEVDAARAIEKETDARNKQLADRLASVNKSLQEVRSHDKASADFLNAPIPDGVRNAILHPGADEATPSSGRDPADVDPVRKGDPRRRP